MNKRILFVDDEPNVLRGLRRMLRPLRHAWEMEFADDGYKALQLLEDTSFDVVISDMRMPGMDGAQLLTAVRQQHPQIVRIILSGHSDRDMILRSVGPAHQCLAKPCDAGILKTTIIRACAINELLSDKNLKRLVAGMQTLPSLPALFNKVVDAIQDVDGSLENVGRIIECDISMTAKMLQLVNSAFFGLQRPVSNPVEAVHLLGLDTLQALILSVQIFEKYDQMNVCTYTLDSLWDHSMAVGACAKRIAEIERYETKFVNDVFVAGLLHDIGKLVLAANITQDYSQTLTEARGITEWERELLSQGITHEQVGAFLLGLWGLPPAIVEAVRFHHDPMAAMPPRFNLLTVIHVANALVHDVMGSGIDHPVNRDYLASLNLDERLPLWHEHCAQVLRKNFTIQDASL